MDEVEKLIKQLKNQDEKVRTNAANALANMVESNIGVLEIIQAIPLIIESLKTNHSSNEANMSRSEYQNFMQTHPLHFPTNKSFKEIMEECQKRRIPTTRLLVLIGIPAIPSLVEAFTDRDRIVRAVVGTALNDILDRSKTIDELDEFNIRLREGFNRLCKKHKGRHLLKEKMEIVRLKKLIAKKKNELVKDKGILLTDKPKPPKGRMYQQARRVRYG
jgi:HEAT repeat protein